MRDTTSAALGGCVASFAAVPVGVLFKAWALVTLWRWFMVPTFELPALTMVQALGVALIAAFLTHQVDWNNNPGDEVPTWARAWAHAVVTPLLFLLYGWLYILFFGAP